MSLLPQLPSPAEVGTALGGVVSRAQTVVTTASLGRRHRRHWVGDGRASIEVRTATRAGASPLREALVGAIEELEGVRWAELDAIAGRVVVDFDADRLDPEAIFGAVEEIEIALGVDGERFSHDRAEHPGDGESTRGSLIALGADAVAAALSVAGAGLRSLPLASEIGSVASFVNEHPPFRREVEHLVGPVAADVSLSIVSAVGSVLSQGPLSLGVDALHRWNRLIAADARRRAWERLEPDLVTGRDGVPTEPLLVAARPVPRPLGPVEQYAERATVAALAGAATVLVTMRSPRHALAVAVSGMSKPARLGKETFIARVQRALGERDVVVLDAASLGLLDSVDCVVVAERLLATGRYRIDRVALSDDEERPVVNRQLRRLFRPEHPNDPHRSGGWTVAPLSDLPFRPSPAANALVGRIGPGATHGLCDETRLAAVFTLMTEPDPEARLLVESSHDAGHLVAIAGDDLRLARRLGVEVLLEPDRALADGIRRLQSDGHVVALVSDSASAALASADIGIGVLGPEAVPWGADLLCPGLVEARFVLTAAAIAHEVGRQSNAVDLAGSAIGAVSALTARPRLAGARAARALNTTALVSMANAVRAARSVSRLSEEVPAAIPPWHEMGRRDVLRELDSSREGLTTGDAAQRHRDKGSEPPAPVELARAVWQELSNPLTPVLAGGALLSASVGSVTDSALVVTVAGLNAVISGVSRFGAERAVRRLAVEGEIEVRVRRDGKVVRRIATELVVGDVVVLVAGDTVPADCRILSASMLEVDEASLTGESRPITKDVDASFGGLLTDRTCMLYMDTTVVAGSALAAVVATGADRVAARGGVIGGARSAGGVEAHLRQLSSISLPVAGLSGATLAAAQLLRGATPASALSSGVSLAVAAVPEGLPMLSTVGQLAAARRLSERSVLVRNHRAIEALGRVEVLCVDKTGTLTEGRLAVGCVSDGVQIENRKALGASAARIVQVAVRAAPDVDGELGLTHLTDRAIDELAVELGLTAGAGGWHRGAELVFGPDHRYHATWGTAGGSRRVAVKGAPEVVLERCRRWAPSGAKSVSLTVQRRDDLTAHVDALARQGLRVLAVAERRYRSDARLPEDPDESDVDGLTLLGFVGLADPVRPTASDAVRGLRSAGVDVVMVTGDHPSTAEGIAAELGLLNGGRVVTGQELEELTTAELDGILPSVTVFARVTPRQKMRIVGAYQRAGRAVAMTGDGANDASAIRAADVGIALGATCTPAARDAADVIIVDERIETLVEAIVEGRALWASMRDALAILLGGNLGEIAYLFTAGGLGGRPALNVRQVLLVNLLTDVAPSLAIASRPPSGLTPEELASEGPDRSLGWALHRDILQRAVTTSTGATAAWLLARGTGTARRASTVGLLALVGTQLGQTVAIGRRDPVVAVAGLGSAAVLAAIVQTPGVSQFFGCTPVGPVGWGIAIGCSVGATMGSPLLLPVIDHVVERVPMLREALDHPAATSGDDEAEVIDLRPRLEADRQGRMLPRRS